MKQEVPYKIYLDEKEIPTQWYNMRADMKNKPAPLLNPGTLQPLTADDLAPIFCDELNRQELDNETRYIDIPQEIRDFYKSQKEFFKQSPCFFVKHILILALLIIFIHPGFSRFWKLYISSI